MQEDVRVAYMNLQVVAQATDFQTGTVVTDTRNGLKYELKTRPGKTPHFALRPHNHHRAGVLPL